MRGLLAFVPEGETVAEVLSGQILMNPPSGGKIPAVLTVNIQFSPREVAESFDYGVNVRLIRYDPAYQVLTRHKGMTAMSLVAIPPSSTLALDAAHKIIKPSGPAVHSVKFDFMLDASQLPSGTKITAAITVVPELAPMEIFAAVATVPAAPAPTGRFIIIVRIRFAQDLVA
jgi:hypothetical protein